MLTIITYQAGIFCSWIYVASVSPFHALYWWIRDLFVSLASILILHHSGPLMWVLGRGAYNSNRSYHLFTSLESMILWHRLLTVDILRGDKWACSPLHAPQTPVGRQVTRQTHSITDKLTSSQWLCKQRECNIFRNTKCLWRRPLCHWIFRSRLHRLSHFITLGGTIRLCSWACHENVSNSKNKKHTSSKDLWIVSHCNIVHNFAVLESSRGIHWL